jgi:chromosome segregation ATPase
MTTENDMQEALMKLLDERAASYGALRQSSLTAIALDRAAQALTATRAEMAAKDARVQALEGEVARLREERDKMHALAKANNDLAKMHKSQLQELRQSQLRLMNDLQACKDALAQGHPND